MSDANNRPPVCVVVLNWNAWQETSRCLSSLARCRYSNFWITVVDNDSHDGSLERLTAEFPDVDFVPSSTNRGFAGGNNLGISRALDRGATYVWLLNNDTEPEPDCLQMLVDDLEANSSLAVVGPRVVSWWDGSDEPANRFPPGVSRPSGAPTSCGRVHSTDVAPGAAMLVRADDLRRYGLLDERYFHFFEDTEFCWRLWQSGRVVGRDPGCTVRHKYASSTAARRPMALYYMVRNLLLFAAFAGHTSVLTVMVRRPALWMWTLGPLLGLRSWKTPQIKLAVVLGICDALIGRAGRKRRYSPV